MKLKLSSIIFIILASTFIVFNMYTKLSTKTSNLSSQIFDGLPKKMLKIKEKQNQKFKWNYVCEDATCKREIYKSGKRMSLKTCNMMCAEPQLWPYPEMINHNSKKSTKFLLKSLQVKYDCPRNENVHEIIKQFYKKFINNIKRLIHNEENFNSTLIQILILVKKPDTKLVLNTNEQYRLSLNSEKNIKIKLLAETVFGARHGLETLYQLIWWDEVEKSLMILHNLQIFDHPVYSYRGLMLDTGNNYFSVKSIQRTLLGMAANKLNVFHWHITDTGSFPYESKNYPDLSKYGAYDENRIYSQTDIKKLVNFAKSLGIRVIIEIDAPGHMLAGWESIKQGMVLYSRKKLTGEMYPKNNEVFAMLNKLHDEIINVTEKEELFHIGGHLHEALSSHENNVNSIYTLYKNLKNLNKTKYTILWSSQFTESKDVTVLDPATTIIQITNNPDRMNEAKTFKIIFSLEQRWFLGCGLGSWSPYAFKSCFKYSTWQDVYLYQPWYLHSFGRIFGGEVVMWSQMVNEDTLDNILWPRTAAFAENIWRGRRIKEIPSSTFVRLDTQRERLEKLGIDSSILYPEWCTLNPERC